MFVILRQFGSGGAGLGGLPAAGGTGEFVNSQQTHWAHPFRTSEVSTWATTVWVKPFTVTPP